SKLRNYALRAELLPWLEARESWLGSGRRALEVVAASRAGQDITPALSRLRQPYGIARGHHTRSGGEGRLPDTEQALERHCGLARGRHKLSGGEELLPFDELGLERHVGVAA